MRMQEKKTCKVIIDTTRSAHGGLERKTATILFFQKEGKRRKKKFTIHNVLAAFFILISRLDTKIRSYANFRLEF
jgi:hypothetical protein